MLQLSSPRHALQSLIYSLPVDVRRRLLFAYFNRRLPHFGRPAAFNDKVNWRILNDRRPLLEWTCDKLSMKDHVIEAAMAGLHVPHTIWSGSDIRDLQAVELPEHWVLKPNHRSGQIYFGGGRPDLRELTMVTATWLDAFESSVKGEWAYSTARPMLLVEAMLGRPGAPPPDYKFFVFDGRVVAIQVDVDRYNEHKRRFYLPDWSPLDVRCGPCELAQVVPPPPNLERMLAIAAQLGQPFDFIRIDLYDVNGVIEFGEFTPYPGGGLDRFFPASFDAELGNAWKLPAL
jgi:hypothetical protein